MHIPLTSVLQIASELAPSQLHAVVYYATEQTLVSFRSFFHISQNMITYTAFRLLYQYSKTISAAVSFSSLSHLIRFLNAVVIVERQSRRH